MNYMQDVGRFMAFQKGVNQSNRPNCELKCVYCEETCETEAVLQGHIQKHWEEKKNQSCPQCGILFEGVQELLNHCRTVHEKKFPCEVCGKTFPDKFRLKKHQVTHSEQTPEKCPKCDKSYYTKNALKTHIYANHTDNIPIYKCAECGKSYKFKKPYNDHLLTHSGHTPYSCDICGRKFSLRRRLTTHKSIAHRNPEKCAYCPKMFKDRYYQREHERTHVNPQVWKCSFCDKQYSTKRLVKTHEMSHGPSKERAECPVCKKTFSQVVYMRHHFTAMHEEEGGYNCLICDKRFVLKAHLRDHAFMHSQENPYKCSFCPYACRFKANLRKHLKKHENGKEGEVKDKT